MDRITKKTFPLTHIEFLNLSPVPTQRKQQQTFQDSFFLIQES